MQESILVETLKAFTPSEMQQLGDFLTSPFFNGGSHANQNLALFTLLSKKIGKKRYSELDKTQVSEALFGGSPGNHSIRYLENRMSELMAAIRKFIAWQEVNVLWGSFFEGIAVARFYRDRDLGEREEQMLYKTKNALREHRQPSRESFLLQFWLEEELLKSKSFRNQREGDLNISASVEALIHFFGVKLLEIALALAQQERVSPEYQSDWKPFIENIRIMLKSNKYLGNPVILLLDEALNLIENHPECPEEQLHAFLHLLNLHSSNIPFNIVQNLASYTRNYCTWQVNKGHLQMLNIQVDLYKEHLGKGWLYEYGKLLPGTFINMLNVGLITGQHDWVLHLLQTQKENLNGSDQERVIAYGYTRFHFHKHELKDARNYLGKLLQSKKFGDFGLEWLVRILEIKVLYEDGDNLIETQLHNFLMFIRRNSQSFNPTIREMSMNFIKMMRVLSGLKEKALLIHSNDQKKNKNLEKIRLKLASSDFQVIERIWLSEKIKEF